MFLRLLFFFKFIYLFWERQSTRVGEAERGRDRIPSRPCTISTEPDAGLELTNCEIMTSAKIKSPTLNQLHHSCTPPRLFFKYLTFTLPLTLEKQFCFFLNLLRFFFKFNYLFWQRQKQREWGRGKERIPSRLHDASAEPDTGLELTKPWSHDLSHPGAPA